MKFTITHGNITFTGTVSEYLHLRQKQIKDLGIDRRIVASSLGYKPIEEQAKSFRYDRLLPGDTIDDLLFAINGNISNTYPYVPRYSLNKHELRKVNLRLFDSKNPDPYCVVPSHIETYLNEEAIENIWYYVEYIPKWLSNEWEYTAEEADEVWKLYRGFFLDVVEAKEIGPSHKELVSKCESVPAKYDLDFWVDPYLSVEGYYKQMMEIATLLGDTSPTTLRAIADMLNNITSPGGLYVYFYCEFETWADPDFLKRLTQSNTAVVFENYALAVVDTINGSGADVGINGKTVPIRFDLNKISLEVETYDYSGSVCGYPADWADSTNLKFSEVESLW